MTIISTSSGSSMRDYIYASSSDGERLEIVHKIDRPHFLEVMCRILDDYGLGQRLENAKASGNKLSILEIGCAEGLFLHDFAEILEERKLIDATDLNGLDFNRKAIATADIYRKQSKPPRPYLNFYLHDVTEPLEDNLLLRADHKLKFDFIYAMATLEFISNADLHLCRFYDMLNPGGVIYMRSVVLLPGEIGWKPIHPALEPFSKALTGSLLRLNNEIDVATSTAKWLEECGATNVKAWPDIIPTGGQTQIGWLALRNLIMMYRNSAPYLISSGDITQAEYDAIMTTIYREVGPHLQGQIASIDTIACKPS